MGLLSGRRVSILGTGMYVPEKIMTNDDLSRIVETSDEWIRERTGITERHIAAENELTSDLAYNAAMEALQESGIDPEELDMIIVGTNSPDTLFPGVAPKLQGMLGASRSGANDIQAGCTSCINSLVMASAGIASGLWDTVLVVGAEELSRILDWNDRNTCVIFGDGAGAVVLGTKDKGKGTVLSCDLKSDGKRHDFITLPGGLAENPASPETIARRLHYVHMKGNDVFKFVTRILPPYLEDFCVQTDIPSEEIDWWIFHQANLRIMQSVLKRLGVSQEKSIVNLDKYGNTSAASTLMALHEGYKNGKIKEKDKVLLTSFGSGMTYGALIFQA